MNELHYFDTKKVPESDTLHKMSVDQGYVPSTCLLSGMMIFALVRDGKDPCDGCACDRAICKGRGGNRR